jgi:hypothetical protein
MCKADILSECLPILSGGLVPGQASPAVERRLLPIYVLSIVSNGLRCDMWTELLGIDDRHLPRTGSRSRHMMCAGIWVKVGSCLWQGKVFGFQMEAESAAREASGPFLLKCPDGRGAASVLH